MDENPSTFDSYPIESIFFSHVSFIKSNVMNEIISVINDILWYFIPIQLMLTSGKSTNTNKHQSENGLTTKLQIIKWK